MVDHLVDTWSAQWREQLIQRHHTREATLRRRIARARNRLAAATLRAEATAAARLAALGGRSELLLPAESAGPKQVTNGVRTAPPR